MFACTRFETKQIMEGKAYGIVRRYVECPHKRGTVIVFTSKFLDGSGRDIPFAKVEIQTIRPGTVGIFKRDPIISEIDGYQNGEHWLGQMRQLYPGIGDDEKLYHLKFVVKELDREAGRRGDVD
jgi:hypothetical protein